MSPMRCTNCQIKRRSKRVEDRRPSERKRVREWGGMERGRENLIKYINELFFMFTLSPNVKKTDFNIFFKRNKLHVF